MNTTAKWSITLGAAILVSALAGIFAGIRIERSQPELVRRNQDGWVNALRLSHSALDAVQFTMLLKAHREGKNDLLADRLETMLDFALIDVAREYSPERDDQKIAAKALRRAADYRAAHPHRSSLESVAIRVDGALLLASKLPNEP